MAGMLLSKRSSSIHPLASLGAGDDPPDEVNVVIEIPRGSSVKYEVDESRGVMFVDRFLYTSTHFPFNYGFIPQTKAKDGDPLDALVLTDQPVFPMSVIRARPIGALSIEDEEGEDVKIVSVPARDVDRGYSGVNSVKHIPTSTKREIEHFFTHYKETEPNKFVKVRGWKNAVYVKSLVEKSILPRPTS